MVFNLETDQVELSKEMIRFICHHTSIKAANGIMTAKYAEMMLEAMAGLVELETYAEGPAAPTYTSRSPCTIPPVAAKPVPAHSRSARSWTNDS